MMREIEILSTKLVEEHLNRNPRVQRFSGDDVLTVRFDTAKPIPRIVAAEARQLNLEVLGRAPYSMRETPEGGREQDVRTRILAEVPANLPGGEIMKIEPNATPEPQEEVQLLPPPPPPWRTESE